MTDKELHKLGRREMLQLMLAQGREAEKAKQELADTQEKLRQLEESYERLKRRLDDKDAQIHKLRSALQSVQGGVGGHQTAAARTLPVPDDYYAPPQEASVSQQTAAYHQTMPQTPQETVVQRPLTPSVQPEPAPPSQTAQPRVSAAPQPDPPYGGTPRPELPPAQRHTRREQEYYDYLFGPVANQGHQVQQQKERQKTQPPPARAPLSAPAEPRAQQWTVPQQYNVRPSAPGGYYSAPQQYRQPEPQPAYQYEREPQPQGAHFAPEPRFPRQAQDEFIPVPEKEPEKVQMLNVVEIVNGLPVSRNQVLRRSP